jgi:PIN domain nuclease of toxin-antitoxin system
MGAGALNLLLDTHILLWWLTDDLKLSCTARDALMNEEHAVWVSAASAWELSTKARLGKLDQAKAILHSFDAMVNEEGFQHLPITYQHALYAGALESDHRDPFDRMLASQAALEGYTLITSDAAFQSFAIQRLW